MTTRTLSTYVAAGYTLSASFSELDITATGGVGGTGVLSSHYATIANAGRINATSGSATGVELTVGGVVINRQTGFIGGRYGVFNLAAAQVRNYGTIQTTADAVVGHAGGSVVNGSYTDRGATIQGSRVYLTGAAGTVTNFGAIGATLDLYDGGTVTNGGVADATALIDGGGGIYIAAAPGAVSNFGSILALGLAGDNGVNLGLGGEVTNGAVSDTTARLEGFTGVLLSRVGTVTNFGTLDGLGTQGGAFGAALAGGGTIVNGGGADRSALIEGYTGVLVVGGAGTVTNHGTIRGLAVALGYQAAVYLKAGGLVTNGGGADRAALIEGSNGVLAEGSSAATVSNFGTILADGQYGVGLFMSGGALTNGSLSNPAALIEGFMGASLVGQAVSRNFGTIFAAGDLDGIGVQLGGGESLINGAAGDTAATIEGLKGVYVFGANNTLTNFATIAGAGGTAVKFTGKSGQLAVEAGCVFKGSVLGGGGTLFLDTGTGTLAGLLSDGAVTVSGSMATTTFQDFDTVLVGAAATFTDFGAVTLAAGQSVVDGGILTLGGKGKNSIVNAGLIEAAGAGVLTLSGAVTNAGTLGTAGGTLIVQGGVTGAGHATINGGTLDLAAGFTQDVTFAIGATGALELAQSRTYAGTIAGFSKTGKTSLDLVDIGFVSSGEATFAGTKSGGVLTVTDGTHTALINLKGNYLAATFVASSDGHGGTRVVDPRGAVSSAPVHDGPLVFASALAGWGPGAAGPLAAGAIHAGVSPPGLLAARCQGS